MDLPILISGGTIVDGSGEEPYVGDMLIRAGRIVEVGAVAMPENVIELVAHGLVVAPGFIDIHSHSDFSLYNDPRAVSSLTKGLHLKWLATVDMAVRQSQCRKFSNTIYMAMNRVWKCLGNPSVRILMHCRAPACGQRGDTCSKRKFAPCSGWPG